MKRMKLQVFVSSTYMDLIEERQAAVEAILDAGHIPAGMELFKAGKSQMKTISRWIDDSDVYMLILGGRYGSIEEESGLSYTQLEYEYALSKNMPVFAIVLDDSFLFTKAATKGKNAIFEIDNNDKYNSFKKIVLSKIVKKANDTSSIKTIIHSMLNEIVNDSEYNLSGWVRNDEKIFGRIYRDMNIDELNFAKKQLNQKINNYLFEADYINYANDYVNTFEEMLFKTLSQQTFMDRFSRQVLISVDGEDAFITMKTHIRYINVKNTTFYRTSPIFPEREQAMSYEHLEFKIDNVDYTDKIKKEVVVNDNNKQMSYLVKNKYPITRDKGNVVIFHKVRYKVDINNFYQLYSVAYPCRDFDVSIILEGGDKDKYRLIVGTQEYYNISSYSEKNQLRDKNTCIIRFPHWLLCGSGYNFTIQHDK